MCTQTAPGVFERAWTYGTAKMDCNSYTATVPCNPLDHTCGQPPGPPPPPPGPPGNWSVHNCTSCQTGTAPIAQRTDLNLVQCLDLCNANATCHYVNWVAGPGGDDPESPECSLFATCGELCLPDHCWNWWVTYESLDNPAPAKWNKTACDSLPEGPTFA